MNRNYRVVFNQSTGTYVAVAENTSARKKSKTTVKTIIASLSVSAMLMGASSAAHASFVGDNSNTHYGNNHIVIGQGAQVGLSNKDNPAAAEAIAIGVNAKALGNNAIALGYNAHVGKGTIQSIAIGSSAKATGTQSTAIGNDTYATGHSSVAIGGDDVNEVIKAAGKEYTALTGVVLVESQWQNTESKGHGSVAIGVQSLAEGNFSTALGMTAKTQGTGSVAFGANARGLGKGATGIGTASQAIAQQATAIGMNSAATAQNATAIGSGGNTPATATKATADGAIAIGGNSVKGSQATGKNAIAIGGESEASKDNAIAIGAGSKSTHGNSVALGVNSVATGANIGNAAWQPKDAAGNPIAVAGNATGEVSIGKTGSERRITNMAAGSADTDGVNVSQLKALDSALTSNVNVLTNSIAKVDGKVNNLQTSVNTLEQGWKLKSDGDVATAVKAGNTVAINSGTNIDVTRTGNTITVNTTQDMTLNSVSFSDTAGNNSVLSASGLNVSNSTTGYTVQYGSDALTFIQNGNTANTVSVGTTGISAGNQIISSVANGALNAASKDAVNGSQLHKTNQDLTQVSNQVTQNTGDIANLSQGWKLQSDNDTASAVKAGDTVQFNSGKNIDVSRSGNTLTIATSDDLNLNSVNLQDASGNVLTTLDASGLNVKNSAGSEAHYGAEQLVFNAGSSNAVSIGNAGINAGNQTITNVADGAINASSKDAINGSQLYDIQQEVQEHIKKAEDNAGLLGSLAVQYDGTAKDHITLGGANVTSTVGISNLADGKVEAGSTEAITGNQLFQTNTQVNQNTADIANLSQGWNLQSDGDAASKVAAGDTVQINSGNNIDVSRNGNTLTIATAADMALNSVILTDASTGNSSVINGNALVFNQGSANAVSIGNTGINAGNQTITNVADGAVNSASKDAINGSQLYNIQQEMQEHIKKAEDDAGILNSLAVQYDNSTKNHITLGGANATSTVGISNLADGKVAAGSKDAVNGGQLYVVDQKVDQNTTDITHLSQGWKIQSDGDTASSVVAGDTVQFNSGKNIDVSRDGNTLTIATADDLNLSSVSLQDASGKTLTTLDASGLNVNSADGSSNAHYGADQLVFNQGTANAVSVGETGINAGNQIISNVAAGDISSATSTEAVNGGQLYQTNQNIAQNKDAIDHLNQGWKLQSDSDIASAVKAGDTVQINSGTNIDVSRDGNTLTIATANDLTLGSITTVDGSGKSSILDANGLQVDSGNGAWASYGAGSSIINDGQGNQASSTATGVVVTDAQNNTTQVGSKGVLLLNPDGSEMANLSQQQLSFSNGNLNNDVTIGMNGISAGNQKITNVAAGVLGIDSKDAVNGGQLYQTNQNVTDLGDQIANLNQGWKLQSNGDSETAIRAGDTVAINSGKNIQVERVGKDITIHTSDDLVVNSVVADDGTGNTMTLTATGIDLQDAAGNTYITTAAGSELTNANGDQTNLSAAGTYVQDALGNNATYGANGISIGNTTGGTVISIKDGDVNFGGNTLGGVGAGVNPDDAINKGQLDNLGDHLAGDIFGGNATYDGNTITWSNIGGTGENTVDGAIDSVNKKVNLGWNAADTAGNTFNVAAGQTVGFINSDGNIDITAAGSSLTFDLAKDINVNSVTADDGLGNKTVLGSTGTSVSDAAGNNAHYGANSSSFTDTAGNSNISSATGTTLTDAAGNTYITTAAGSELTNANGDITHLTAAGTEVTDALGNNATYGANGISVADAAGNLSTNIGAGNIIVGGNTHTIAIDGNTGEITGLGNTAYDPSNVQVDRAATEGQVQDALKQISQQGFGVSAQGGMSDTVALGETVDFASKDGNIAVSAGADNQILFQLSDSLNVSNITIQDANGNVNYSDATGNRVQDVFGNNAFYGAIGNVFTDKAGNSFNNSAAGSHISNSKGDVTNITAAGTQVNDAAGNNANYGATGNTITNAAGDNTNVSAGNITVGTGNGGSVSIGGNGIDAGGNQITNVADGKAAGDAVNKGQLDQAVNDINNSIGAVNNSGVQYDKNADGTINKDSITLAGGANGTTITNVANGKVEAGSKDAVNGGQLHDALQQINNNQSTINNDILGITTGPDGKPKLDLDIYDVANQTKTGDLTLVDAINTVNQEGTKYAHTNAADESEEPGLINPDNNAASAGGKNSSAFGVNAIVDDTATNGLAMGYQSQVGEGATNAVSIGSQTQANGESSLAMGHGSQANGKQSISIGTGNTVNGNHSGAIGDPSTVNGDGSYSIGNNNTIDADNSFVLGNEVTISKDATDMSKANSATFGGSVGLGNGSTVDAAIGTKNVTIGDTTYGFAGSAPVGTISVGGKDAERTITNVAAGRIDATSTDAINGSQLYATNQAVDSLIKGEAGPVQYVKDGDGKAQNVVNLKGDADSNAPVTLSNVADGKAPNDAVNVSQMQKMGDKINARIDGLEDESRAGVATALAVANLPQVYIPGKSGLAIATGVHKGEVGYALGYSSISEGGNWVFKASATANRMGDVGGGAGLLYMFD